MDEDIHRWRSVQVTDRYSIRNLFPHQKVTFDRKTKQKTTTVAKIEGADSLNHLFNNSFQSLQKKIGDQKNVRSPAKIDHPNHSDDNPPYNLSKNNIPAGGMLDMLKEFDTLKFRKHNTHHSHQSVGKAVAADTPPIKSTTTPVGQKHTQRPSKKFVAVPQFSLTKHDHYKVFSSVDRALVQDGRNMKHADIGKLSKLKEYQNFLKNELSAAKCPPTAPDKKRLQIFSACFEKLIQDFSLHGELLTEIKREYEITLSSFKSHDEELQFLRGKVQKLLSDNENRMMLKFEKQKCKELERKIAIAEAENTRLKQDIIYKISVYSNYLPKHITHDEKNLSFEYGKDPLSIRDSAITEMNKLLEALEKEVELIIKAQNEDYVPKESKEILDVDFAILQEKYKEAEGEKSILEKSNAENEERIKFLEEELAEKEKNYKFLLSEFMECMDDARAE